MVQRETERGEIADRIDHDRGEMRADDARCRLLQDCEGLSCFGGNRAIGELGGRRRPNAERVELDAELAQRGDFAADEGVRRRRILAGKIAYPDFGGLSLGHQLLYSATRPPPRVSRNRAAPIAS